MLSSVNNALSKLLKKQNYNNTYKDVTYNDFTYNDFTYNDFTYKDFTYNDFTYYFSYYFTYDLYKCNITYFKKLRDKHFSLFC
jgi:hypothetical protein